MVDQATFEDSAAICAFKDNLKECTVLAACGRPYVLISKFTQWLQSKVHIHSTGQDYETSQANRLLQAMYRNWSGPAAPIHVQKLLKGSDRCLLVFSILIELELGNLVHEFLRKERVDRHLPIDLYTLRQTFSEMNVPKPDQRATDFDNLQWRFCPAQFDLDMGREYWKDRVLPICSKQPINLTKGGTAKLWQIAVLEEFVGKELREAVKNSVFDPKDCDNQYQDNLGPRYQFALKVFDDGNKALYENERNAFFALRNHGGMVRYLGEYAHKEIRPSGNTLQAPVAGDCGNEATTTYNILLEFGECDLDEFFIERNPPSLPNEIEAFWKSLFDVANAVERIHNLKTESDGMVREFIGWHADIKPDNVLIIEDEDSTGNTREKFKLADPGFAKFVAKTSKHRKVKLVGGTETYGAPERHRGNENALITQTIDTWSLGCVFSLAATWVVLGYEGIKQFNKLRIAAIRKKIAKQTYQTPLPKSMKLTQGDYFHDGVGVLGDVSKWHIFVRGVVRRTDSITGLVLDLVDQKMLLGDPDKRVTAKELCAEVNSILEKSRQEIVIEIPKSIMEILLEVDQEAPAKVKSLATDVAQGSPDTLYTVQDRKTRKSKFLAAPLMKTSFRSGYLKSELAVRNTTQNLPTTIGGFDRSTTTDIDALKDISALQSSEVSLPSRSHVQVSAESGNDSFPQTSSPPQLRPGFAPPSASTSFYRKIKTGLPQNVFQAREEVENRQKGVRPWKVKKDKLLEQHFKDRDIVFLVDNAETMRDDWFQATYLLETLVMKAKGQDEDGMDLLFTIGNRGVTNSNLKSAFAKAMDKERPEPGMHTDIRIRLGEIFDDYIRKAQRGTRSIVKARNLTLIVLTDGIWSGTGDKDEVRRKIVRFVKDLTELVGEHRNRPVSIEFIQFGNDPDATHRLRSLDDDLKWDGIPDIIDTEHCLGDINKMLLGSFVEEYDVTDDADVASTVAGSPSPPQMDGGGFGASSQDRSSVYQGSMMSAPPAQGLFDPRAPSRRQTEQTLTNSPGSFQHQHQHQPSSTSRSGRNRASFIH